MLESADLQAKLLRPVLLNAGKSWSHNAARDSRVSQRSTNSEVPAMLRHFLAMVFATVSSACASIPRYSGRIEPVAFANGDVALSGILVKPSSAAPYSAVVFIHGSGPSTRDARAWK